MFFESETSAEKAVDFLKKNHTSYDVVLMDIEFKRQRIQGLEAVKEIRLFSKIPIIMISASKEACLVAAELGANSFMPKGLMGKEEIEVCKKELEKVFKLNYGHNITTTVVKKDSFTFTAFYG